MSIKVNKKKMPGYLKILISIYFILEFFEPYFNVMLGSYTKYYLIFLILIMIYYYDFKIYKDKYCVFFCLWLLYKVITVIWTQNTYIFNLHFFTNITAVILLYLFSMYPMDKRILICIIKSLWIGSGIIGGMSLFSNIPYMGVSNRIVLELFGVSVDPNNDAAFLAVGIAISLYFVMNKVINKRTKILSMIIFFINTYALFMTGSRGGLLTEIAIVSVFALFSIRNGKNKFLYVIGMIIIVFVLNYLAQHYLPKDIYYRLFNASTYEGGSNRTDIWSNAMNLMKSNPLFFIFGSGWGAYYGYNNYYVAMHNTFISMFCDTGIIGMSLFYYPIIKIIKYLYKNKVILPILLLVAGFVPAIFLEAINKRFFWNAIIVLMMFYKYHKNQDIQNL